MVREAKNGVSQQYIGPLILEKIQMYTLTRAELLYTVWDEIPCMLKFKHTEGQKSLCTKTSPHPLTRQNTLGFAIYLKEAWYVRTRSGLITCYFVAKLQIAECDTICNRNTQRW